ncbi:MAG: cation transporter [Micrococcales bacterium]|nr:cation transporter [Micrococcales bacterium]
MTSPLPEARVRELNVRALHLSQFTIGYNVVEAVLMISAGISAGLVSAVGFGIDSAIESASAVIVLTQVRIRLSHGHRHERSERRALKMVAVTFFALAGYVIVQGVADLIEGEVPKSSPLGMGVLVASLVVMPLLIVAKTRIGRELGDPLILADAAETKVCLLMSASTLLGLVIFSLTGVAWVDPAAGFVIAVFAIREGREAWEGELVEAGEAGG